MAPSVLETAGLRLRLRNLADLDANIAMDLDPLVRRSIGNGLTHEGPARHYRTTLACYRLTRAAYLKTASTAQDT